LIHTHIDIHVLYTDIHWLCDWIQADWIQVEQMESFSWSSGVDTVWIYTTAEHLAKLCLSCLIEADKSHHILFIPHQMHLQVACESLDVFGWKKLEFLHIWPGKLHALLPQTSWQSIEHKASHRILPQLSPQFPAIVFKRVTTKSGDAYHGDCHVMATTLLPGKVQFFCGSRPSRASRGRKQ
jgi:hypothetical protein